MARARVDASRLRRQREGHAVGFRSAGHGIARRSPVLAPLMPLEVEAESRVFFLTLLWTDWS